MQIKVIAEIGINHEGDFDKAKKLIDSSKASEVWGVKFQYRNLNRSYHGQSKEIGDESLKHEIKKVYLSPPKIFELTKYAKDKGLKVGISFFIKEDILDFNEFIEEFDFYKIPSVELSNLVLIDYLMKKEKLVLLSTGCHDEYEIKQVITHLKSKKNWMMLHCVSNYPLASYNAKLGYIKRLEQLCEKNVGYSSHDQDWELCLLALKEGATIIERHITLDKKAKGLDHSTSSTPDEFKKLGDIIKNWNDIYRGNEERVLNQGELLNKQNLGRSFVSLEDYNIGDQIDFDQLDYRSPKTGLDINTIGSFLTKKLVKPLKKGEVLQPSHFSNVLELTEDEIQKCISKRISLPIRIHDAKEIQKIFPLKNFEFHLSYVEVLGDFDYAIIEDENQYSIHLPDYIDSVTLIDPFSEDSYQKELSNKIIRRCKDIGDEIYKITQKQVVIVGSFSLYEEDQNKFYFDLKELFEKLNDTKTIFIPQWLPPIAWYFGGSIVLDVFNNNDAIQFIEENQFPICLDISHLFMCKSNLKMPFENAFETLLKNTEHIHIADAKGIDGEGIEIGFGDEENLDYIKRILQKPNQKVIEVWQGHLDFYAGFRKALKTLSTLIE